MALILAGAAGAAGTVLEPKQYSLEGAATNTAYINLIYDVADIFDAGFSKFTVTCTGATSMIYIYDSQTYTITSGTAIDISAWDRTKELQIQISKAGGSIPFTIHFE